MFRYTQKALQQSARALNPHRSRYIHYQSRLAVGSILVSSANVRHFGVGERSKGIVKGIQESVSGPYEIKLEQPIVKNAGDENTHELVQQARQNQNQNQNRESGEIQREPHQDQQQHRMFGEHQPVTHEHDQDPYQQHFRSELDNNQQKTQ